MAQFPKEIDAFVGEVSGPTRTHHQRKFFDNVRHSLGTMILGFVFVIISIPVLWFNERRSAKIDALVIRGQAECLSVDAEKSDDSNTGRLVHIQGKTRGCVPVCDVQFQDAVIKNCLKLQSTVEVFQWVQTSKSWLENKEKKTQHCFHTEWSTVHHDSSRFRKPSPENPRTPSGLNLGTFTSVCKRVELGAFTLTEDMVDQFCKFEPAMKFLPSTLTACNHLLFTANPKDGYYYARPGYRANWLRGGIES